MTDHERAVAAQGATHKQLNSIIINGNVINVLLCVLNLLTGIILLAVLHK